MNGPYYEQGWAIPHRLRHNKFVQVPAKPHWIVLSEDGEGLTPLCFKGTDKTFFEAYKLKGNKGDSPEVFEVWMRVIARPDIYCKECLRLLEVTDEEEGDEARDQSAPVSGEA